MGECLQLVILRFRLPLEPGLSSEYQAGEAVINVNESQHGSPGSGASTHIQAAP